MIRYDHIIIIHDPTSICHYMIIILSMARSGAAEPFPLRLEMPRPWGDWTIEHRSSP
jgi:hypothetical protein